MIISSLLCSACANTAAAVESESQIPLEQDTLGMVPDFSYAVIPQLPYIYVDQIGYRSEDKKTAFFQGTDLETAFSVLDEASGETVYEGKLYEVKELEGKTLYAGDFTWLSEEGDYVITHPKIGDSYTFTVEDSVYDKEFLVLQKSAKEYTYTSVSELTYVLANLMFIQEICDVAKVDVSFIEEKMILLLNSQDA